MCLLSARPVLFLLCGLWAGVVQAQIEARLQASRIDCTAPCAVQFDASASSHDSLAVDSFTDLEYLWHFGDAEAGQWSTGALRGSRNEAIGPLATHVFERPGTYTARVRVFDAAGAQASAQQQIRVADPDAVFAGTATTCLALDNLNWAGCPQGARREVGSDALAAYTSFGGAGRRLLLRRGDAFNLGGALRLQGQGPGQIGAFGSGVLPRLLQGAGAACIEFGSTQQATRDFSVFGLRCEKPVAAQNDFSSFLTHPVSTDLQPVQHILVGRVEASGYAALQGGPLLGDPPRERIQHVTLYEAREDGFTRGGFVINFPFGRGLSWLGVRIDRSSEVCASTNSVMRSSTLQRAVISQVEFVDSCTGPLRLHSMVTSDPDGRRPEKIVVTRSFIGGINASSGAFGGNGGPVSVEPGVSAAAQFRDYVFEANFVRYRANNNAAFDWSGRNFVARNNVFDLRGAPGDGDAFAVFVKSGGDHGTSSRMRFIHNTVFQLQGGPWQAAFANYEGAAEVRAYNNALRTVSGSHVGALLSEGFAEQAGNLIAGPAVANPLVAATPAYGVLGEYCPRPDGAFAAAASPRRAALDAFGRPRGAAPSAGFCELGLEVFANGFEP